MPLPSLLERPHRDARAAIARGPAFLLVNPVEYHGPHLSLENDHLVSEGLARDTAAGLVARHPEWEPCFVGELGVGVEPIPGPGSRPTPFPEVRARVLEACDALADLGATRVVIVTFHGSPLHNVAVQAGVDRLASRGVRAAAPASELLRELGAMRPERYADVVEPIPDAHDRAAALADLPFDLHAGFGETSLALHYAPSSVSDVHRRLPPCPPVTPLGPVTRLASLARATGAASLAGELAFAAYALGWMRLRPFPAYTGRPHLANAESGRRLAAHIVARAVDLADDVFAGRRESPRPMLGWAEALSLGGRVELPGPRLGDIASFDAG